MKLAMMLSIIICSLPMTSNRIQNCGVAKDCELYHDVGDDDFLRPVWNEQMIIFLWFIHSIYGIIYKPIQVSPSTNGRNQRHGISLFEIQYLSFQYIFFIQGQGQGGRILELVLNLGKFVGEGLPDRMGGRRSRQFQVHGRSIHGFAGGCEKENVDGNTTGG